ncbi:MAG: hypothetical protein FJY65_00110 [Calditrichaeota bacterium]|nr:hypothetical protein [Calditrichota bacterium]
MPYLLYLTAAVFIIGSLYRLIRIIRMPVHLRWELYPVPHEPPSKVRYGGSFMEESDWWLKARSTNKLGALGVMLPEIFLLKVVWERNRLLWIWSFLMHWGLYLFTAALGLTLVGSLIELAGTPVASEGAVGITALLFTLIKITSWAAGITGAAGCIGMLLLRIFSLRMRPFTSFATILNLILILLLFGSGLIAYSQGPQTFKWLFDLSKSAISFKAAPPVFGFAGVHFITIAIFGIYFPFTHMTHMFVKYFTYHRVRWDDKPMSAGSVREQHIINSLKQPVTWAAPHIRGDGKKNWIDIVSAKGDEVA